MKKPILYLFPIFVLLAFSNAICFAEEGIGVIADSSSSAHNKEYLY